MIEDENSKKELAKEINLMCKLKHTNIIGFFGYIYEDKKFGIVLEFCNSFIFKFYFKKNKKIN
jgi:serine/threonine protein kinase